MDETEDIADCMTRMRGDRQPFAVATVVRTEDATAAKAGAKAVIRADGTVIGWIGGGCAVGAARKAAAQALLDGKVRLIRVRPQARASEDALPGVEYYINSCASGGVIELFIEPVLPKPALVVAGASPTAHALADLGRRIGFAVHVAALKEDLAGFASADERLDGFDLAKLPRIADAFVVVATQGKRDREALTGALASPAGYVAFVGSRRKVAVLSEAMVGAGLDRAALARLKAPAGLDIGASTPEEIALSVLAEIVQLRRRGIIGETATAGARDPGNCCAAMAQH